MADDLIRETCLNVRAILMGVNELRPESNRTIVTQVFDTMSYDELRDVAMMLAGGYSALVKEHFVAIRGVPYAEAVRKLTRAADET